MTKVVVVGAGPAGIAAVWRAAQSQAQVTLIDPHPRPGGQIWLHADEAAAPKEAKPWLDKLDRLPVTRHFGSTVIDILPSVVRVQSESGGLDHVEFDKLILAPGAQELFLPFPGWTLPYIMGAGGALALLRGGMPVKGLRIVVAGSGPLLFAVAGKLAQAGARIIAISEQTSRRRLLGFGVGTLMHNPGKILEGIRHARHYLPSPFYTNTWIKEARGDSRVREVTLTNGKRLRRLECDLVACGFGLVSSGALAVLAGCDQQSGCTVVDRFQQTSVKNIFCAGEITGIGGVDLSVIEGEIAGLAAAGNESEASRCFPKLEKQRKFARWLNKSFALKAQLKDMPDEDTIICRCEDITYGQLKNLADQCSAKLYTRCGMGPCQGRICSNALKFLLGWDLNTVRPPVFPAKIGDLISKP
jgi:NADPH-dependent 2,4-dienoyl-CoA reductase/sulfur reductase-like enzyme